MEILHRSMQYLCMYCLDKSRGVSGIFGGIYPALEIGFSLVGGERGFRGSKIRARVFEGKTKHQNYHGCWSGSGITGKNLERAIPKSHHPQKI